VSVHLSEEEQLEAMKRWWKEYGKTIIISALVAIGAYFAWNAWQDQQRNKAETASATYEELLKVVSVEPGQTLGESERSTAEHLAAELKAGDSTSLYAHNAAFFLAKIAIAQGDLDKAVTELRWVLSQKPDLATEQLANLRLARVLLAQQHYDEALNLVQTPPTTGFASEYAEVHGDVLKAKGDLDAARTAYEKALSSTTPQQQERFMVLQMKLDDLKQPTASIASPTATPEETAE
jgi:predicted negative regulator of RcsB-dependent stress response